MNAANGFFVAQLGQMEATLAHRGSGRVSLSAGDGFPRGRVLGGRASAIRVLPREDQFAQALLLASHEGRRLLFTGRG